MEEQINPTDHPEKNPEVYKALLQLDQKEQGLKAKKGHFKSYVLSAFLPPIGLYYFFKYFFFTEGSNSGRKAAVTCLVLTILSLILNIWLVGLFFNQVTAENSQNMNMLKELITPENQKTLQQLLQ